MPDFQSFNYAALQPQDNGRNLLEALQQGLQTGGMPFQMRRQAESEELANAFKRMQVQNEPENERLKQALMQAQTKDYERKANSPFGDVTLTGPAHDAYSLEMLRKIYSPGHPVLKQAEEKWESDLNKGQFGTAALREQNNFNNLFKQDNLDFSPEQIKQAKDRIMRGEFTLEDGTPIQLSKETENSLDRLFKYGTTSAALNRNILGSQAEAEIEPISKAINRAFEPYGNRFSGYSYDQIVDSFDTKDEAAQKRLGRYAGAKMLNYELNQLRQMLAAGKSTVDASKEMRHLTEADVKEFWPFKTEIARKEAMEYVNNTLKEAFKARKNVGVGAYSASQPYKEKKDTIGSPPFLNENNDEIFSEDWIYNPKTKKLEKGK